MAKKSYPKPVGWGGGNDDCSVMAATDGRLGLNPYDDEATDDQILNRSNPRKGGYGS